MSRPAVADQGISLITNDIVYDAMHDELLASVPGSVRWHGNSILRLDPDTLKILGSAYVGSEPGRMALSDSGDTLYVALLGSAKIAKYDVASRTITKTFNVGIHFMNGFLMAEDLDVQPGSETVIAVSRENWSVTDREGAAIFDDGVQRPWTVDEGYIDRVAFGEGSRLYGLSVSTSSFPFTRMTVTQNGVVLVDSVSADAMFDGDFEYASGRVYTYDGNIYTPEPLTLIGNFNEVGPPLIDVAENKVYVFARNTSNVQIDTYELNTLKLLHSSQQPHGETPLRAVKCGKSKLAYTAGTYYGPGEKVYVHNIK